MVFEISFDQVPFETFFGTNFFITKVLSGSELLNMFLLWCFAR